MRIVLTEAVVFKKSNFYIFNTFIAFSSFITLHLLINHINFNKRLIIEEENSDNKSTIEIAKVSRNRPKNYCQPHNSQVTEKAKVIKIIYLTIS